MEQDQQKDKKNSRPSFTKPSLPQGTRDFGPDVVRKRQFILNTIRSVFELYGFQPLETPAMENLDTLMGKYGDEGDKLIFKILNNGLDHPSKEEQAREALEKLLKGKNTKELTERALKYDLTIPFARYMAMNHAQLALPFKRYQVQPVWRADRPQKGRYREFYQCDADVAGSRSLLNEIEFISIYREAFSKLGIAGTEIRINSRKILTALAEHCGGIEKIIDITVAIDKLDKIGIEKVKEELFQKALNEEQVSIIENYLSISGSNEEKINSVKELFKASATGLEGITELEYVLKNSTGNEEYPSSLMIDLTLARGLNYYTGMIFEVKAPEKVKIGSIGGGGRYDNLTGSFGVPGIPGAGISFGVDRIYDVMEELDLFPKGVEQGTRVLFFNMGEAETITSINILKQVRNKGIPAEIFHEHAKMDKQFKYAEKKNIRFVAIIGSKELEEKQVNLKDIINGEQRKISFESLADHLADYFDGSKGQTTR
jgi:histidyl-tRNA synthetase